MEQLLLKYNQLNDFSKGEISDFLDYLLSKEIKSASTKNEEYKKKILKVSTGSNDEIKELENNIHLTKQQVKTQERFSMA